MERSASYQVKELEKGMQAYARLGLTFTREEEDTIRFWFTRVDPMDPDRAFCFSVFVSDDDVYSISRCEPHVAELPELVAELNQTGDLSSFVQAMRAAFNQAARQ